MKHTIDMIEAALTERARWKQQGVAVPTAGDVVRQHIGQDFHYISFTSIEKLGINPSTTYATPIGIYAYPLGDPWFEGAWEATSNQGRGAIPFAVSQPYIQLFRAKNEGRVVAIAQDGSILRGGALVERAMRQVERDHAPELESIRQTISRQYEIRSDMSRLWLTTMLIAQQQRYADKDRNTRSLKYDNQHVVRWTKMLMDLGIDGVEDRGSGTIHENEPHQAVMFNKRAVEQIDTIVNPLPAAKANRAHMLNSKKQLADLRWTLKTFTASYDRFIARANLSSDVDAQMLGGYLGDGSQRFTFEEFVAKHGVPVGTSLPPDLNDVQAGLTNLSNSLARMVIDHDRSVFVREILFNKGSSLTASKVNSPQPVLILRVGRLDTITVNMTDAADFGRTISGWSWRTTLGARAITLKDSTLDMRALPSSETEKLAVLRMTFAMEGGEVRVPGDYISFDFPLSRDIFDEDGNIKDAVVSYRAQIIGLAAKIIVNETMNLSFTGLFMTEKEAAQREARGLNPTIVRFV